MNWIKKNATSLSIILVSSLLSLVLAEVGLRLFNNEDGWGKTREANILRNFEYQYNIKNLYESDISTVDYVRNNYGLRDNCSSVDKIEILTIGGSTTDQRYVSFEETYQAVLQNRLIELNPNFGCVTNAGVDGHSTLGHIFSFEHWFPLIPKLKPSYVLFYVGINDVKFNHTKGNPGFDYNKKTLKTWLKQFEIVQRLLPIYRYIFHSNNLGDVYASHNGFGYTAENYTEVSLNETTDLLSRENSKAFKIRFKILLNYAEQMGATPLCVTQPHRYVLDIDNTRYGVPSVIGNEFSGLDYDYSLQRLYEVMSELCGENLIDLYNFNFKNEHFYDGVHTTGLGSVAIGNLIADFLKNHY